MGAPGAVNLIFRKEIETADDPEAKRAELIEEYTERFANPYIAAERGYVDDVIDPRETRTRARAGRSRCCAPSASSCRRASTGTSRCRHAGPVSASISPDATPEEVAAIVAALGALRAAPVGARAPTTRSTSGCARRGSRRAAPGCSAARGGCPAASAAAPAPDPMTDGRVAAHAELMSVGPDEVVVTFTTEPGARVTTRVGDREVTTDRSAPHRARRRPRARHRVRRSRSTARRPTTGCPPTRAHARAAAGRLLATIATANDVHFGETECGRTGDPATDAIGPILRAAPGRAAVPRGDEPARSSTRCARSTPTSVVVKGDLTDTGPRRGVRGVPRRATARLGARMHHVRGNHDAMRDPTLARRGRAVRGRARRRDARGARHRRARATSAARCRAEQLAVARRPRRRRRPARCSCSATTRSGTSTPRASIRTSRSRPTTRRARSTWSRGARHIVGYFAGHTHTNRVRRDSAARDVPLRRGRRAPRTTRARGPSTASTRAATRR